MYFESRLHNIKEIASSMECAKLIKEGKASIGDAMQFNNCLVVADGNVDDPFFEVAVLQKAQDGSFDQIESITNGWISSVEELAKSFDQAVESPCKMGKANITFKAFKPAQKKWFTCGCCDEDFLGIAAEQAKFDQDAGYGICPPCAVGWS
ncbi:MAG: hypothetical protein ABJH04_07965 [Cyclobacteriaceae bacterium]